MKRWAGVIYAVAGIASAWICFMSLTWAVWGAPTSWIQYVGLLSSLGLVISGVGAALTPDRRNYPCFVSALGMGVFYVPAIVSTVPAAMSSISPASWLIELAYLALLAATLRYPRRIAGARGITIGAAVVMSGAFSVVAFERWRNGEYNRPDLFGLVCAASQEPLAPASNLSAVPPPELLTALAKAGAGGPLQFGGVVGGSGRGAQMFVVAAAPLREPRQLRYPRRGTVVYFWDGTRWLTFPERADCYSSFATLQPDGMVDLARPGEGTTAFLLLPSPQTWPRRSAEVSPR